MENYFGKRGREKVKNHCFIVTLAQTMKKRQLKGTYSGMDINCSFQVMRCNSILTLFVSSKIWEWMVIFTPVFPFKTTAEACTGSLQHVSNVETNFDFLFVLWESDLALASFIAMEHVIGRLLNGFCYHHVENITIIWKPLCQHRGVRSEYWWAHSCMQLIAIDWLINVCWNQLRLLLFCEFYLHELSLERVVSL